MVQQVNPWNSADGELTLDLIQSLHVPAGQFRISHRHYDAGTQFGGSSRAQRFYLLSGSCEYTVGDATWEMAAPCFADLPAGEFRIRVSNDAEVSLVNVWNLPPDFRQDDA